MIRFASWLSAVPRRALGRGLPAALGLALCAACASPPPAGPDRKAVLGQQLERDLRGAGELYRSHEYVRAADSFARAADLARELRLGEFARDLRAAECTSWLKARRLSEFAACGELLEAQTRAVPGSNPGVNTVAALGAVAGGRPLPPLRLPGPVQEAVRAAAQETKR